MMLGPIGLEEERSVVAVAIDRNDKHSFYALQWTTDVLLSKGQTLTLIHVNESSLAKPIPSMHLFFSLSLHIFVYMIIWLFFLTESNIFIVSDFINWNLFRTSLIFLDFIYVVCDIVLELDYALFLHYFSFPDWLMN